MTDEEFKALELAEYIESCCDDGYGPRLKSLREQLIKARQEREQRPSERKMLEEAWNRTRKEIDKNLFESIFADDWKAPPPIHWTLKDRIKATWDILLGKRDPYE